MACVLDGGCVERVEYWEYTEYADYEYMSHVALSQPDYKVACTADVAYESVLITVEDDIEWITEVGFSCGFIIGIASYFACHVIRSMWW